MTEPVEQAEPEQRLVDPLPLAREELTIGKRVVETARVRISVSTHTDLQPVSTALYTDTVSVTRVPIGRIIDQIPATRMEGDVEIIPVVEEIAVVERRLLLKEELHVSRVRSSRMFKDEVAVRRQSAVIDRLPAAPASDNQQTSDPVGDTTCES